VLGNEIEALTAVESLVTAVDIAGLAVTGTSGCDVLDTDDDFVDCVGLRAVHGVLAETDELAEHVDTLKVPAVVGKLAAVFFTDLLRSLDDLLTATLTTVGEHTTDVERTVDFTALTTTPLSPLATMFKLTAVPSKLVHGAADFATAAVSTVPEHPADDEPTVDFAALTMDSSTTMSELTGVASELVHDLSEFVPRNTGSMLTEVRETAAVLTTLTLEYDNFSTDIELLATDSVVITVAGHAVLFGKVSKQVDEVPTVIDSTLHTTGNTAGDVIILLDVPDSDRDSPVTVGVRGVVMLLEDNEHELDKDSDILCCPNNDDDSPTAGVQDTTGTKLAEVCSEADNIGAVDLATDVLLLTDADINEMADDAVLLDGTDDSNCSNSDALVTDDGMLVYVDADVAERLNAVCCSGDDNLGMTGNDGTAVCKVEYHGLVLVTADGIPNPLEVYLDADEILDAACCCSVKTLGTKDDDVTAVCNEELLPTAVDNRA